MEIENRGVVNACSNTWRVHSMYPRWPLPGLVCPLQALQALPGPTSRWARAWSRSHRTGPLMVICVLLPSHPPPEPLQPLHQGPALPLPSPAGGRSWRSGAACNHLVQARGRGTVLGQWPPPHPCWEWLKVWADGTGRRCGSGAGWGQRRCPSGMRVSSGCVGRGHSQSSRDTPEWRLPRDGVKEQGKGMRVGAAGADCPCLHAAPQSRPPSQSRVRLQPQCGPKMRVPLMGTPGAPPGSGCCGDYISSHLLSKLTQIYSHCRIEVDGNRQR